MSKLELWGGHECTINRVGDAYLDQTELGGHYERVSDIDAFASLGLKAIRYPVLWERVSPDRWNSHDWSWTDDRLARLKDQNLRVIAGLVHHGSGPNHVDLLSREFAPGLARHAGAVARRYPWIEDWTPVNEPLTTARFSALYGHWFPHARDERLFWLALLNQIDAIRAAMAEIRRVNAEARLVQTEDLGRTYAAAALASQAKFDNARRWMTWDLLFGRVTREHGLWRRLVKFGFEDRVRAIADAPCPPDIVGVNHYLTSDRFLDGRCARYPQAPAGGNGRERYVDLEAVRVLTHAPAGFENACREAWRRYHTPVAMTEVHNGCTREEQVRWFADAWHCARRLRREGVDLRGVTAWSLLGAYDWDSLLTRRRGHYEPGVFDVSSGVRRPTALARYLRKLSEDEEAMPEWGGDGWWRRDIRLAHPASEVAVRGAVYRPSRASSPPILVLGASGTLGQAFARACAHRDLTHVLTNRSQLPLCDEAQLAAVLRELKPRAVINATGWVRVDDAEHAAEACRKANTEGAVSLARVCAEHNVPSVSFSSDLVFDGAIARPYNESDTPNPLNTYGASKAEAERSILALGHNALIIRTAAFFSPHDDYNFAAWIMRELKAGRHANCPGDVVVSPTYVPDLTRVTLDLLQDGEAGIWHLANRGALSWADFGRMIARAVQLDVHLVQARSVEHLGWAARRPRNSALASERGVVMNDLDDAIWRFASSAPGSLQAALA